MYTIYYVSQCLGEERTAGQFQVCAVVLGDLRQATSMLQRNPAGDMTHNAPLQRSGCTLLVRIWLHSTIQTHRQRLTFATVTLTTGSADRRRVLFCRVEHAVQNIDLCTGRNFGLPLQSLTFLQLRYPPLWHQDSVSREQPRHPNPTFYIHNTYTTSTNKLNVYFSEARFRAERVRELKA